MQWLESVIDIRQQAKVKHLMQDIIAIVFFAQLANANEWVEIHLFAVSNEKFLRKPLELTNGIPAHDTIQRVFAMVSPEYLQNFHKRWNDVMSGSGVCWHLMERPSAEMETRIKKQTLS